MKLLTVLVLSMLACTACTNGKKDVNACLQPTPPIVHVDPTPVVVEPAPVVVAPTP